jgi:hypothetical protein
LAFLRAFIDDSAGQTGDQRLFMAGYLHRAEDWAAFSEVWDRELRAWPAIKYFKMAEANNLRDQFDEAKGWTKELCAAKVYRLAEIVEAFAPLSFEFTVNRRVFYDELTSVSPRGLGNPYFSTCFHVISGVAQWVAESGTKTPIEFIFDEQDGVDSDMGLFFSYMKSKLPFEAQENVDGVPLFRSDKDPRFLPLQAADLLAWHLRREHEKGVKLPLTDMLVFKKGHLAGEIPDEVLRDWAEQQSKMPGISQLQSKEEWRGVKKEIKRLMDLGIDPSTIAYPPTKQA